MRGGCAAGRVRLGSQGTRPAGERRLQGSWTERHARSPHPLPLAPRIPTGLRATGSAAPSRREVTNVPPLGVPASLRKDARRSQCAFCFGYREARLGRGASLSALGEELRGRWAPARVQGQGRQGQAAAGSGTRRVITFGQPGRAPRLPNSFPGQNLPAAFGFCLMPARLETPSLSATFSLVRSTIHRNTLQVSDSKGRTIGVEDPIFPTTWGQKPCQSESSNLPGWALKEVWTDSVPTPHRRPRRSRAGFGGQGRKPSSPTAPAALKSDPKEFRIRFQNTAEPGRTNTPRCRGHEGNHSGQGE